MMDSIEQSPSYVRNDTPETVAVCDERHQAAVSPRPKSVQSVSLSERNLQAYPSYIERFREDIQRSINPDELIPHMLKCSLLTIDAMDTIGRLSLTTRKVKVELVLSVLKEGDYSMFKTCLEDTTDHIGHVYILSLLNDVSYASSKQVKKSEVIKECICKHPEVFQNINVPLLRTYLFQSKLLTRSELESIVKYPDHNQAMEIRRLLETKGPTAFKTFRKCLKQVIAIGGHPPHQELLELITKALAESRKRKHSDSFTVTKRMPDRLHLQGGLESPFYTDNIAEIRRLHLLGKWEEADEIAKVCFSHSDNLEVHIAIKLECCTGLITRKQRNQVLEIVKEAQQQCTSLADSENSTALNGRCQWVLAKLYRYEKQLDLAKEHIRNAKDVCFNLTAGEDTALINYCSACILLESNANEHSSKVAREARRDLSASIDHAKRGDYGLSLDHPLIRLAQLYLGSSPHTPGKNAASESINEAKVLLRDINTESLAKRTLCIFHYTESDVHRNENNLDKALESAKKAMELARANGFVTEITSIEVRLAELGT